jgi:uncharacterized integral membrane protein
MCLMHFYYEGKRTYMFVIILILLIIILLIILFLFSTISIQLQYSHLQDSDCLKLKALIWKKIAIYKLEVPVIKVEEDKAAITINSKNEMPGGNKDRKDTLTPEKMDERMDMFQNLLTKIVGLHQILNRFLQKVHVKNFKWHSDIGLGDAALTGLVTGCVWGVKGGVIGLIGNKMKFDNEPQISINPLFQMNHSQTNLSCIISFKIGNAILVALQVVKHWKGRQ